MNLNLNKKLLIQIVFFCMIAIFAAPAYTQELWKGVVVDPENDMIYSIHPDKGIDATMLVSGKIAWHSDSGEKPLLVKSSQLIAQSKSNEKGILALTSLDKNTGALIENISLTIPSHINARISHGLNQKFDINVDPNNPASGNIVWKHKQQKVQGMLTQNTPSIKFTYGEVLMNQGSISGAHSKTLSQKPQQKTTAIEGHFLSGVSGRQFKSLLGDYILVSNLKEENCSWNKYKWDIYDLEGNSIGSISTSVSYNTFTVHNDILLFVTTPSVQFKKSGTIKSPLSIQAFSLKSGKNLWTKEIRDLNFIGKVPH